MMSTMFHHLLVGSAFSLASLLQIGFAPSPATASDLTELKSEYTRPSEIPHPEENPFTVAKADLGYFLFFEPLLSDKNNMTCGSCHNPSLGWEDGLPTAIGFNMDKLGRKTPTILNMAWGDLFMWDGRFETLEEQALGPIQAEGEMHQDLESLVAELSAVQGYRDLFEKAFPGEGITEDTIGMALATYQRTIVSGTAPFDRWISGDEAAISSSAKRGFEIFNGKASCAECHNSWNFTDNSFHDIGMPGDDLGRGVEFPNSEKLQHAFKTPTLRNAVERAPYMHDGSIDTLEQVVDHYAGGFIKRPSLSDQIKPFSLSDTEKSDLLAFLGTLSSVDAPVTLPVLPR